MSEEANIYVRHGLGHDGESAKREMLKGLGSAVALVSACYPIVYYGSTIVSPIND